VLTPSAGTDFIRAFMIPKKPRNVAIAAQVIGFDAEHGHPILFREYTFGVHDLSWRRSRHFNAPKFFFVAHGHPPHTTKAFPYGITVDFVM
jgi:hypothetical protein